MPCLFGAEAQAMSVALGFAEWMTSFLASVQTDVRGSATEQLPMKHRKMSCLVEDMKELAGNEGHGLVDVHNAYSNLNWEIQNL